MRSLCFFSCGKGFAGVIRRRKLLKVVTADGKVLVFTSTMLVEDVLLKFSGLGVGIWKRGSSSHLAGKCELRLGKVYYMLPVAGGERKMAEDMSARRVKIVITKQKLRELLAKQISMADVVAGMNNGSASSSSSQISTEDVVAGMNNGSASSSAWTPKLETIPEEEVENTSTDSELCNLL